MSEERQIGNEEQEQKDFTALLKKLVGDTFESKGFMDAVNVPRLKGRIITFRNGIQYVETDSKEEGKRLIPCLEFTLIYRDEEKKVPAQVGDWVEMVYMVHKEQLVCMWTGKIVREGNG